MRLIYLIVALAAAWVAAPAAAQGPQFVYCYATNAKTGTTYISDMHRVGPVSERRSYGEQFSSFLAAKGKVPKGTQGYCVMRATEREIERGQLELPDSCRECAGADKFEQVAWLRNGKDLGVLLAGKLERKTSGTEQPKAEAADEKESPGGIGAFVMIGRDERDVIFTANQENARYLTQQKADLRGGKWSWLLSDDRCPGWIAIAYASDGTENLYFAARGGADEGGASRTALARADAAVERKEGTWITGVLAAFHNDYRDPGPDFSDGAINGVKREVHKMVTTACNERNERYATMGVRG